MEFVAGSYREDLALFICPTSPPFIVVVRLSEIILPMTLGCSIMNYTGMKTLSLQIPLLLSEFIDFASISGYHIRFLEFHPVMAFLAMIQSPLACRLVGTCIYLFWPIFLIMKTISLERMKSKQRGRVLTLPTITRRFYGHQTLTGLTHQVGASA